MADTFESFNRKLVKFTDELGDDATMHAIGKMAKAEADKAASADLGGDPKFSGWAPELKTRYDIVGKGRLLFKPASRRAAGPWTVAELGRNTAAGPRLVGPRLTRTGRVSRARQKRWNGRTEGKGTATTAVAAIDKQVSKIVDQRVSRAIRKTF